MVKDMKGGGKGCIDKRAMGRKGMERAKYTIDTMMHIEAKEEEVMLMKVMEGKDNSKGHRSFFIVSFKSNRPKNYKIFRSYGC
jgi:hypothetical protein